MTRLPSATVNDDSLRRNVGVSAGLHLLILLFLYFGLPVFMKPLPTPFVPIPVDIVDIADITNTRLKDQMPEPPKPPDEPPPQPVQKVAPPPPAPTPPTPPEPPKPQPQETKPEQVEAIAPPKPEPKPEEKPPPKPQVKPEAKQQPDNLASVLKNVEKMKPADTVKTPPTPVKTETQTHPKTLAPSLSDRLTVTEEDALRRQIEQCWNPPIGARNAQTLVVEVMITVNPDRTVQTAEVVDKSRMNGDPYFRAAAEAAIRAVYNPRCSPLELPDGKYDQWKVIDFNFDPRDML
jgi:outer membrane biosynthesis protein TonB